MKTLTITAAAILAASTAVHAGGLAPAVPQAAVEEPAPAALPATASVSDWTGFYVGIQQSDGNFEFTPSNGAVSEQALEEIGLHAGYLHDFGKIVLGGEVSYSEGNAPDFGFSGHDMEITRYKLIAGYDLGRLLPYVTVGYNSSIYVPEDLEVTGPAYSVGVDYKLFEHLVVGAEYAHTEYDNDPVLDGTGVISGLVLRASYKF